ncbi:MAG: thioredoxin domain-containing protein [Acidimicrobiales bacterium]
MNRLALEGSPYLRQHAQNPVEWFPWCDEAFDEARRRDVPVFLSVGYSACHWCHVMAHESFEDPATASQLNDSFVSIKVDREERPDIDALYMEAVQALIGSGGWPMSVFLTPDQRPFYGGTYFPPRDRAGTPSFRTLLSALTGIWTDRRQEVEEQASQLARAIATGSGSGPGTASPNSDPSFLTELERTAEAAATPAGAGSITMNEAAAARRPRLLVGAVEDIARRFDPDWGGFGRAPKFPQPTLIDLVLRYVEQLPVGPERTTVLNMATRTLDGMAAGGVHDHLGGGFARYSTDDRWLVPHFEKMLYDQAALLQAYLHAWQVTGSRDYLLVVEGITAYVERDLTQPSGGVASAEDADSEGVEGRFYVWTPREMAEALGRSGQEATGSALSEIIDFYGVTERGDLDGRSVLHRPIGAPLTGDESVQRARKVLLDARARRERPGLDNKVLTEWNAMYAAALAEAAQATGRASWRARAVAIGEFLSGHLVTDQGRWLRVWQPEGGARVLAYAGDYAWLIDCFTRLYELTGGSIWFDRATSAADGLIAQFADEERGGFFTTGSDADSLIVRTKDLFDGATPSANAVAARSLARLGALSGVQRYENAARSVVDQMGDVLAGRPAAAAHLLITAELLLDGFTEVVIPGTRMDLVNAVHRRWLPSSVLAWGDATGSPLMNGREDDRAYVCRDRACQLPADDVDTLLTRLVGKGPSDRTDPLHRRRPDVAER